MLLTLHIIVKVNFTYNRVSRGYIDRFQFDSSVELSERCQNKSYHFASIIPYDLIHFRQCILQEKTALFDRDFWFRTSLNVEEKVVLQASLDYTPGLRPINISSYIILYVSWTSRIWNELCTLLNNWNKELWMILDMSKNDKNFLCLSYKDLILKSTCMIWDGIENTTKIFKIPRILKTSIIWLHERSASVVESATSIKKTKMELYKRSQQHDVKSFVNVVIDDQWMRKTSLFRFSRWIKIFVYDPNSRRERNHSYLRDNKGSRYLHILQNLLATKVLDVKNNISSYDDRWKIWKTSSCGHLSVRVSPSAPYSSSAMHRISWRAEFHAAWTLFNRSRWHVRDGDQRCTFARDSSNDLDQNSTRTNIVTDEVKAAQDLVSTKLGLRLRVSSLDSKLCVSSCPSEPYLKGAIPCHYCDDFILLVMSDVRSWSNLWSRPTVCCRPGLGTFTDSDRDFDSAVLLFHTNFVMFKLFNLPSVSGHSPTQGKKDMLRRWTSCERFDWMFVMTKHLASWWSCVRHTSLRPSLSEDGFEAACFPWRPWPFQV